MRNFVAGIQAVVENPTHVYKSKHSYNRLQFVSHDVQNSGGYPLSVIIQMEDSYARVVTASLKTKITGEIVWDRESGLYVSYDKDSDILYFSQGAADLSYATDDDSDERIWLRRYVVSDEPSGVTIFDAMKIIPEKKDHLIDMVADFLGMSSLYVREKISQFGA